jgi:hypothetical protein
MTKLTLEERVMALEQAVLQLQSQMITQQGFIVSFCECTGYNNSYISLGKHYCAGCNKMLRYIPSSTGI